MFKTLYINTTIACLVLFGLIVAQNLDVSSFYLGGHTKITEKMSFEFIVISLLLALSSISYFLYEKVAKK